MQKKLPKVSIITATFNCVKNNRSEFLKQCINSVHGQTYKNTEHIIIDNASTDGTLDILNVYKDKNWIKVFSSPDDGIYDAMNRGCACAKGEYILFLNSDDFLANEHALQTFVESLKTQDYDFVASCCNVLDRNDKIIGTIIPHPERIFSGMPFAHPAFLVKREIMKSLGGFNTKYKIAGDYDLILRMCLSGAHGITTNNILTNFRCGGISETKPDITKQETKQCLMTNLDLSEPQAEFAEQWGYIPTKLLQNKIKKLQPPFYTKAIRKYNISRMFHFWGRWLFTVHLGTNTCIKIFGITIFNNVKKQKDE